MYRKEDYHYDLPEDLIAQFPAKQRPKSRLLLLNKADGAVSDAVFSDIERKFRSGDVLVLNNTKVMPARLKGKKATGGAVEVFLLNSLGNDEWEVMMKPSARVKKGVEVIFGDDFSCVALDEPGSKTRKVRFDFEGDFWRQLDIYGSIPLPPYIKREATKTDASQYQTVFAEKEGAVAAPTAGLHFDAELLARLKDKGVAVVHVTLHVGYGTFHPVKTDDIREHQMHTEIYEVSKDAAVIINQAKAEGRRVVACGTTVVRTLESAADGPVLSPGSDSTNIFIYPPYQFKIVDALITNFHLPESTLLMLVSAFAGYEKVKKAYEHAVKSEYRFFSYGDAMFIY